MNWLGNSKADMASAIFRESWIKELQTLSNSFTQLIGMLSHTVDWFMSFPTASLQLLTNKGQTEGAPTSPHTQAAMLQGLEQGESVAHSG